MTIPNKIDFLTIHIIIITYYHYSAAGRRPLYLVFVSAKLSSLFKTAERISQFDKRKVF